MGKRLVRWAVALGSLIVIDQGLQWTLLRRGEFLGQRVAPYDPPLYSPRQRDLLSWFETQLQDPASFAASSLFDADLGWCPKPRTTRGKHDYDQHGARVGLRPYPLLPVEAERRRVALVGCSFTEGHEVGGTETWAAQLEALEESLDLVNLGVGGYGADQAYLRALRDAIPLEPDEVWFGLFPGGALRVTTHFPPILHQWRGRSVLFKPMIEVIEGGDLRMVPSPAQSPEEVLGLLRGGLPLFEALEKDHWVQRSPACYSALGSRWQHHSALARIGLTWLERGGREAAPRLGDSEDVVFQLHRALLRALQQRLGEEGKTLRVVVLPAAPDLALHGRGEAYWLALTQELKSLGIPVADATGCLQAAGGAEAAHLWQPEGHYSPEASERIARMLQETWF